MKVAPFLRTVVLFTLAVEAVGAAMLYPAFRDAGIEAPLWQAVFHAVSAFCTAGFSLFPDSLVRFAGDPAVLLPISALSLIGAMGFLVMADGARALARRRLHLGFASKVILRITGAFLAIGSAFLAAFDPLLAALPWDERLLGAFFQTMTATTTVGFNSVDVAALAPATIMLLIVLMAIGASPAGTGGGPKTTSFAALFALVQAVLRARSRIRFAGRVLPDDRVRTATASLAYFCGVLVLAMLVLLATETGAAFDAVLFEAVSALGTVGLSLGLTGALSDLGKRAVVVLMTAGRLGILTFGIAIALRQDPDPDAPSEPTTL